MNGFTTIGITLLAIAFAAGLLQGKVNGLEERLGRIEAQLTTLTETLVQWHTP